MRSHAKAPSAGSTQRSDSRHGRILSIALLLAAIAACLAPSSVSAAAHLPLETFGSSEQPSFLVPQGMAVQSDGDLLVMDGGDQTIKRYNEDGTASEFSSLASNEISGISFGAAGESQVAVDNSGGPTDGNIYVVNHNVVTGGIRIYSSTGAELGELTQYKEGPNAEGSLTAVFESCGVAVGPEGAVYVGDFGGQVHKYVPSGAFPVDGDNTGNFSMTAPCTLAAGSGPAAGFLFAAEYNGSGGEGHVLKLDAETGAQEYVVSSDANTTLSVDPVTGHVFAVAGAEIKEFDASGPTEAMEVSATELESAGQGVAVNGSSGNFYATRAGFGEVEVFGYFPRIPKFDLTIDTGGGTGAGQVNCEVNGGPTIDQPCDPEYPEGTELKLLPVGSNSSFEEFANATGSAETICESTATCEFEITEDTSLDALFAQDPPTVVSEPASGISKTLATLNGTVNPNGANVTECTIEYGETVAYEETPVPCDSLPGSGTSPVPVSAEVGGLSANTTYHYRVVAANLGGTANGGDEEFTTSSLSTPIVTTTPGASEIAQISAKVAGTVNPSGLEVAQEDCVFEYGTTAGSLDQEAECESAPGSGTSPVGVSAVLSSLSANTTYHFKLVATNADDTGEGAEREFTTLPNAPAVTVDPEGAVAQTTAALNGHVNANGVDATCSFQVTTAADTTFSSPVKTVNCTPNPVPGGGGNTAVSATATGLSANTNYIYRVVATNTGGITNGTPAEAFTTLPEPPTVITTAGATEIAQSTAKVAGTVNPNGGNVTACKVEYGTTASYGSEAGCATLPGSGTSPVAVSASLSGLNPNTTYHFRFKATNGGGTGTGADQTFKTLPKAPVVTTDPEGALAQTTAVLNGHVDNESAAGGSACSFQVTLESDPTYTSASTVPCTPTPVLNTANTAVTATATGLTANTKYIYRVVATSIGGTSNGSSEPFTTVVNPPAVTTTAGAAAIGQSTATVAGTVNPNSGNVSACKVEYGTSTSYGSQAGCASLPGSGSSAVGVSAILSGLSAATTYHFRVVATNLGGTTDGADQTFTTAADTCATKASLCPPPSNAVKLGSAKQKGSTIALKVTVPGPGALVATGKNLKKAKASAGGPGTLSLKLKLNSAGQKKLKSKGKLKVKVKIAFTPSGGSPATTTKTVTFKGGRK